MTPLKNIINKTMISEQFKNRMKTLCGVLNESVGITLNNKYIAGVKNYIEQNDKLIIPEYYEYNIFRLNVDGVIDLDGEINIM